MGIIAVSTSTHLKVALADAMMKSQLKASSKPPPHAMPRTAATVGTLSPSIARNELLNAVTLVRNSFTERFTTSLVPPPMLKLSSSADNIRTRRPLGPTRGAHGRNFHPVCCTADLPGQSAPLRPDARI